MKKILLMITVLALCAGIFSGCKKTDVEIKDDTVVNDNVVTETEKPVENEKEEEKQTEDKKEDISDTQKPVNPTEKPVEKPVVKPAEKPQPSLNDIMDKMVGAIPADEHSLSLIPGELYKDMYGVDKSNYEDVLVYGSMMSVKSNEIILIKVKKQEDIASAKKVLEERKNQVYKTWEQYLPDQFEIVKNAQIKSKGNYIALIIAPYTDKVVNAFMSL